MNMKSFVAAVYVVFTILLTCVMCWFNPWSLVDESVRPIDRVQLALVAQVLFWAVIGGLSGSENSK